MRSWCFCSLLTRGHKKWEARGCLQRDSAYTLQWCFLHHADLSGLAHVESITQALVLEFLFFCWCWQSTMLKYSDTSIQRRHNTTESTVWNLQCDQCSQIPMPMALLSLLFLVKNLVCLCFMKKTIRREDHVTPRRWCRLSFSLRSLCQIFHDPVSKIWITLH